MQTAIFHLAFPIGNVPEAKAFYVDGLGCELGRESHNAVILNLYGTQLVGHVTKEVLAAQQGIYPRHFGVVFETLVDWQALHDRAISQGLTFYQNAKRRFPDTPLDHQTFFLQDPFHNLLEFKHYYNPAAIFDERAQGEIGDRVSPAG
ncbi:VOC family protein [filamentous cyanobacterium LEGE 11480]|uniref:VOC family protein n=1 Tax=Romeriopsis navalis LEGE 11480 TaxID=2777977 RepID=A0A928VTW4_9CYAN|nr:VOC family protein [Romeriopsis navalis]MBE9032144.1 VOC family protein [Romeriopsis navalis LEGE 11480]